MSIWIIYFIIGIVSLYYGSEILINNGKKFAYRLSIPEIVIGITIVAFGTSLPELLVSLTSNLRGESGLALGNVIGSNIANIGLVLGLSSMCTPLKSNYKKSMFDLLFLFLVSGLLVIICYLGDIDRTIGLFFLFILALYLWSVTKRKNDVKEKHVSNESIFILSTYIFFSLLLLYFGTDYFIKGAIIILVLIIQLLD